MLKTSLLKALSAFALAAMLLAVAGCARPQSTFVPAPLHSLRGRYLGLLRQPVLGRGLSKEFLSVFQRGSP